MEYLKELHIPFQTKVLIYGREVDFLVKKYAIEIDGHEQDVSKNYALLKAGYTPWHFYNWEIKPSLKEWLRKL